MVRMKRETFLLAALALACAAAHAQSSKPAPVEYKPTPAGTCDYLASTRIGPEFSNSGLLLHELPGKLGEARAACEQAVLDQPASARLWGQLARVRAVAGDGAGALEAARKGAELGSATAQVILGVLLADGAHVPRDYPRAREHFLRAAKLGMPYAHFNLGVLAANGWGIAPDDADAQVAFYKAAEGRDPLAMQLVAQRYDEAQAERWLRKAAEAMYPDRARNPLRMTDLGRAEPDGAALVRWYEARARGGEPWAQAYMGMLHEAGQWVRQDYARAVEWYRPAGEAGYYPAQLRMAMLYRDGRGVPRDEAESRRWALLQQVQRCDALERAEPGANPCDRLAADRYDRERAAAGVDAFCMRQFAERAVAACTIAAKQSPSTLRYRTQLARALAHTGRFEEARREAGAAAAGGSTAAMILMGVMSQRGLGTAVNEKEALAWYRKAAEAGDPRGLGLVMTSVYSGVGVAKDSPEASALVADMRGRMGVMYRAPSPGEQAEKGDPRAQHNLAAQLEREQKYDEAIKWYTRAAEQGFRPSEMNLAQMYEKGIGMKQDTAEARKRYRRLAEMGEGEARYRVARLAADAGDHAEALTVYQRAIRDDDYRAMLDLGQMHEEGRGVPKSVARAVALYERAADRSPWARYKLGLLYLEGTAVAQDYAKARYWLQRAAGDGNAGARNNLAVMADRGLGVAADHAAARDLYLAALRGGSPQAKGNLENFFAAGRGAPSGAAALDWYRPGAEAGIASAQYRVGHMYAKGEGVARDDKAAADWLLKAAQQGHAEARKEAAELLYTMGRYFEAAGLGHEGAARKLAEELTQAGKPEAARELLILFAAQARELPPPAPAWPRGFSLDAGADPARTIAVRVGGVGSMQAVGVDAGMTSPYEIIRWYPETDGKAK